MQKAIFFITLANDLLQKDIEIMRKFMSQKFILIVFFLFIKNCFKDFFFVYNQKYFLHFFFIFCEFNVILTSSF